MKIDRLTQALIAYAALTVAAFFLLSGTPLLVVLVMFGYLAFRLVHAHFKPPDE